jgi:hypothetical protein
MRNIEVIKQFLNKSSGNSDNGNVISTGDRLINYNTCLAEWNNDSIMINVTKYSSSTSRIQNMLISTFRIGHKVVQIENVPINTRRLWNLKKM